MIHIVHGQNLTSSRNYILGLQKNLRAASRIEFSLTEISSIDLSVSCRSFDMFGNFPFVVLDISAAGRINLDEFIETAFQIPEEAVLVIFSSKQLGKTNAFIKHAVKLKAKLFESKEYGVGNVFDFVDKVFSGNRKASYSEFRKLVLTGEEPMYLFSMLMYGLRNLGFARFDSSAFAKVSPFVKHKVTIQAKNYSDNSVLALYEVFYKMDVAVKTGNLPTDLLIPLIIEKVLKEARIIL